MKLVKKWMVVLFVEEKAETTYTEKIQTIINNKNLNKEVKLNLISLIRDSLFIYILLSQKTRPVL